MQLTTALAILAAASSCIALPTGTPPSELRNTDAPMSCVVQGDGLLCKATDDALSEKRDGSSAPANNAGLQKRCFDNGGGWYWCSFARYTEENPGAAEGSEEASTA